MFKCYLWHLNTFIIIYTDMPCWHLNRAALVTYHSHLFRKGLVLLSRMMQLLKLYVDFLSIFSTVLATLCTAQEDDDGMAWFHYNVWSNNTRHTVHTFLWFLTLIIHVRFKRIQTSLTIKQYNYLRQWEHKEL